MTTWKLDSAHSEVGFKVKHLMISTVRGKFSNFEGSIVEDGDDFTQAKISVSIDTDSIHTGNDMRDGHLKGDEFFHSGEFPKITFHSKHITKTGDDTFAVTGDLTMRGVTNEVVLNAVYNGSTDDAYGVHVKSFEVHGSLSRESFGLVWNAPLTTGGVAVSDEVKLEIIAEYKEEK